LTRLRAVVRLSRPLLLLFAFLLYTLGAGIARYLGHAQNAAAFWLGLVWVAMLHLSMNLLAEYFRPLTEPLIEAETRVERSALRLACLLVSAAALTCMAVLTVLMLNAGLLTPLVLLFFGLTLLAALAYALPPLRLMNSGFGELALAIFLADLIPALAFLLQTDELHRLLTLAVFSLTCLALAFFIAMDFPAYAADLKRGRRSLLIRLNWQRAVPLHHLLILVAYSIFAAAPFLGFPFSLIWPVFLTLPLAILQILWLRNISLGGRPVWRFMTANAAAIFGLTTYVLALTFWIR